MTWQPHRPPPLKSVFSTFQMIWIKKIIFFWYKQIFGLVKFSKKKNSNDYKIKAIVTSLPSRLALHQFSRFPSKLIFSMLRMMIKKIPFWYKTKNMVIFFLTSGFSEANLTLYSLQVLVTWRINPAGRFLDVFWKEK